MKHVYRPKAMLSIQNKHTLDQFIKFKIAILSKNSNNCLNRTTKLSTRLGRSIEKILSKDNIPVEKGIGESFCEAGHLQHKIHTLVAFMNSYKGLERMTNISRPMWTNTLIKLKTSPAIPLFK